MAAPEEEEFPVFKKQTFAMNETGTKKRIWKSLKQILAHEKTLQWPENAITCKFVNTYLKINIY